MAAARLDINPDDRVKLTYRLNGCILNFQRVRVPTKITKELIVELQYADAATLLGCGAEAVQRDSTGRAHRPAGVTVNIDKTQTMAMRQAGIDSIIIYIDSNSSKMVDRFTYLDSVLKHWAI